MRKSTIKKLVELTHHHAVASEEHPASETVKAIEDEMLTVLREESAHIEGVGVVQ